MTRSQGAHISKHLAFKGGHDSRDLDSRCASLRQYRTESDDREEAARHCGACSLTPYTFTPNGRSRINVSKSHFSALRTRDQCKADVHAPASVSDFRVWTRPEKVAVQSRACCTDASSPRSPKSRLPRVSIPNSHAST